MKLAAEILELSREKRVAAQYYVGRKAENGKFLMLVEEFIEKVKEYV